jgi:hypothetical protein
MSATHWSRLRDAGRLERAALQRASRDMRRSQLELLKSILASNAGSGFGAEHRFADISSLDEYRSRVPVRDYEGLAPWIARICQGDRQALTADMPIAWEQTGGSSGGRKLIPYTRSALDAFRHAVLAWLGDLLDFYPRIAEGRAYFAISPATRNERSHEGGLPVGLESDAAYFGQDLSGDVAAIMIGAGELSDISEFAEWQLRTLACLTAADDLTLISIWSPTFLLTLLDALERDPDSVARRLRDGVAGFSARPEGARLFEQSMQSGVLDTARLWPRLQLISAWADAGSARFAGQLQARFAGIAFQPKGLLATEGVFTLPLIGAAFPVPALTSCFLEFEAGNGRTCLVGELERGADYQLVATTPGGLYRYRIGDVVRCNGTYSDDPGAELPMLSFLGRAHVTLDMVGEKLEEGFVADCLSRCVSGFAVLVPAADPNPHYLLLLQSGPPGAAETAIAVDRALQRNPLYADARRIGQLAPLVPLALPHPVETYVDWRMSRGHRLGDVKLPVTMASIEAAGEIWPELLQRCARLTSG